MNKTDLINSALTLRLELAGLHELAASLDGSGQAQVAASVNNNSMAPAILVLELTDFAALPALCQQLAGLTAPKQLIILDLAVAHLQNDVATLQNAFATFQNPVATLQNSDNMQTITNFLKSAVKALAPGGHILIAYPEALMDLHDFGDLLYGALGLRQVTVQADLVNDSSTPQDIASVSPISFKLIIAMARKAMEPQSKAASIKVRTDSASKIEN